MQQALCLNNSVGLLTETGTAGSVRISLVRLSLVFIKIMYFNSDFAEQANIIFYWNFQIAFYKFDLFFPLNRS